MHQPLYKGKGRNKYGVKTRPDFQTPDMININSGNIQNVSFTLHDHFNNMRSNNRSLPRDNDEVL